MRQILGKKAANVFMTYSTRLAVAPSGVQLKAGEYDHKELFAIAVGILFLPRPCVSAHFIKNTGGRPVEGLARHKELPDIIAIQYELRLQIPFYSIA